MRTAAMQERQTGTIAESSSSSAVKRFSSSAVKRFNNVVIKIEECLIAPVACPPHHHPLADRQCRTLDYSVNFRPPAPGVRPKL